MKENLLNLFIDKLYEQLKSECLGFKIIHFANGHEYTLCELDGSDIVDYNHNFLLDNLEDYFFSLRRNHKDFLPIIFHDLILNYPNAVFTQLSSFPIFNSYRKGIDDSFPSLDCIFNKDDLALYLKNYKDKKFLCPNYYCFEKLLNEIKLRFQYHKDYKDIILYNCKVHSNLIKKTNGNTIATRSWCLKNLSNTDKFEDFITLKDDNNLFDKIEYFTSLIFININTVQSKYVISHANGVDFYKNFMKSLTSILNTTVIKKELNLERVEGQLIFDNTKYQLTLFSNKALNCDILEKNIEVLLDGICEYYNKNNKKAEDFENFIFKFFQFRALNEKLVPLGKKSKKATKI